VPNVYLKLHLYDGSLVVCERWEIRPEAREIACGGNTFDALRNPLGGEDGTRPYDEIALVELTRPTAATDPGYAVLGALSSVSAIATTVCLVTLGACFGN
jgi:hypothetical protein